MSLEGKFWDQKPALRRGKRPSGHSLPGCFNLWETFPLLDCHWRFGLRYTWQPLLKGTFLNILGVTSFDSTCSVSLRRGPPQWCPIHLLPWSSHPCSCSLLWWVAIISMGSVCLAPDSADVTFAKEALCSGLSTAPKGSSSCDLNQWSRKFRITRIPHYGGAAK